MKHLNSDDRQIRKGVLNNIKHLDEGLGGDHVTVELGVYGARLELFMKNGTKYGEELERLRRLYGVNYTACSNTMKAMNVKKADLIDQVNRTVSAMVRLTDFQEAGWVYIRS